MKNLYLTVTLLLFTLAAFAQESQEEARPIWKFKTYDIAFMYKLDGETKFGHREECDIVITVNLENEQIHVFSKEEQEFDIVKMGDLQKDEDGDSYWNLRAVDKEGIICELTLYKLTSRAGRMQLYVRYSDVEYVYNMYKV